LSFGCLLNIFDKIDGFFYHVEIGPFPIDKNDRFAILNLAVRRFRLGMRGEDRAKNDKKTKYYVPEDILFHAVPLIHRQLNR
jgi:hypothetical protein